MSESTGDLALPTRNENSLISGNVILDHAAELQKFETQDFPESPPEDSNITLDSDVQDSPMSNHVQREVPRSGNTVVQPSREPEKEYYGFKMFVFLLFILALIMIPIAIIWETRKTYFKSTDPYKGLARWMYKSFGFRL